MGYTHYWSHPAIGDEAWAELAADTERILATTVVPIAGPAGTKGPIITHEAIRFNGVAATDDDYETFELTPAPTTAVFDFCKTGLRPYDAVVGAVLLRAYRIVGGFSLRSDGDISGGDWREAEHLYRETFGEAPPAVDR